MRTCPRALLMRDELKEQLTRREWPAGTAIPSENALAEQYGISRPSVRKVLSELCQLGFLERQMGRGTYVREASQQRGTGPDQPFLLGTDAIGSGNIYYSSLARAIRNSPYGRNIFLNLLKKEDMVAGKIPKQVNALLFARDLLPERAYQKFAQQRLPMAHINRQCEYAEVAYATVDHTREAERAVQTLFQFGYRRVMLLAYNAENSLSVQLRARGWESAYQKNFGHIPEELRNPCFPSSPGDFPQWMSTLQADAYFFVNAAQYELFRLDYARCTGKIPIGLPAIVFDDMDVFHPDQDLQVNFLRMPMARLTQLCIEYLWQKLSDPNVSPIRVVLPCDLILRTDLKRKQ